MLFLLLVVSVKNLCWRDCCRTFEGHSNLRDESVGIVRYSTWGNIFKTRHEYVLVGSLLPFFTGGDVLDRAGACGRHGNRRS